MSIGKTREVHLRRAVYGPPSLDHFQIVERDLDTPGTGLVQVRNLWMSVEPYMRGRMKPGRSYIPAFEIGSVLEGHAVGQVVVSHSDGFEAGDLVISRQGWREAFNATPDKLSKLPSRTPPASSYLGILGVPGFAAHIGLNRIIGLEAGERIYISGGSGCVGITACQLALMCGAEVIASAGSDQKVEYLRGLGVPAAFNYKTSPDIRSALKDWAPDGIDAYFDNVGGPHLEAALAALRPFGRIALCGMISQYNEVDVAGPRNLILAIGKRLRIEGFIIDDHMAEWDDYLKATEILLMSGRISMPETVVDGIDAAPEAFIGLFRGDGMGKVIVNLARSP